MGSLNTNEGLKYRDLLSNVLLNFVPLRLPTLAWKYFPLTLTMSDEVEIETINLYGGGMAPITAPGSESPLFNMKMGGGKMKFSAIEIREKFRDDAELARNLRLLGTCNEKVDKRVVLQYFRDRGRGRIELRKEWMLWEVLVKGNITYTPHGGGAVTVINYSHPAELEVTAGTPWTNTAASQPIDDLVEWSRLLVEFLPAGYSVDVIMRSEDYRLILQSDSLVNSADQLAVNAGIVKSLAIGRDWLAGIDGASPASPAVEWALNRKLDVGGANIIAFDGGVEYYADLTALSATGATTVVLDTVEGFEVGQKIQFNNRPQKVFHRATITAINTATRTVTYDVANPKDLPVGTQARVVAHFIPLGTILMIASFDMSKLSDEELYNYRFGYNFEVPGAPMLGKAISTPNRYFPNDRRAGFFAHTNETNGDPPAVELINGLMVLPQLNYPEFFLRATIY